MQDIVESLRPRAAGIMRILADFDGHSTQDNLKVLVERGAQAAPGDDDALRETVAQRIRNALSVKADVRIVPYESFERPGATKVKLVLREAPAGLEGGR